MRRIDSLLLAFGILPGVFSCLTDLDCSEKFLSGTSKCVEGSCTNPYYEGGCLKSHIEDWEKIRVCNSDDPPDAEATGACRQSPLEYMEVRALAQDWDSSLFATWILQIILSEILDVPVSVEASSAGLVSDFYHQNATLDFGSADSEFQELTTASKVVDCRNLEYSGNPDQYEACAHVVMEAWDYSRAGRRGVESARDLGALGEQHWWVPRFTMERDPTLVSYAGLQGEENRFKLAQTFKRPTTWKQYCDEVSTSECSIADDVATRPPKNEIEDQSMFVEGLYTGHFRATEANNCTAHPFTCTGHITDYPCAWTTKVEQQTYHLNISLKSSGPSLNGGYTFNQLYQIWQAANATKSDVMMMWWRPEFLYDRFVGTDAEFTRVGLPPPTQECIENSPFPYCAEDIDVRRGEWKGACDYEPTPLKKLAATSLRQASNDPKVSEAQWSPAYDAFEKIQISSLQYGEIFQNWFAITDHDPNFAMREATCKWVVDNMDIIQGFIPDTYPRVVEKEQLEDTPTYSLALAIGAFAMLLAIALFALLVLKRNTRVVYYAQFEFLSVLLFGSGMVVFGAILMAVRPTDSTCIAFSWFLTLGYVLQVVALALRALAINKLHRKGKQMQRVRLRRKRFYRVILVSVLLVAILMALWTIFFPPFRSQLLTMEGHVNDNGETVVTSTDSCSQISNRDNAPWSIAGHLLHGAVIFPIVLVTLLSSKAIGDINDTKDMALLSMVHLVFLVSRATVESFDFEDDVLSALMGILSILHSVNMILGMGVYIVPKVVVNDESVDNEILPDLFLDTTIMIADIVGFTAWSSVREPIQVFKFLESVYEEIDAIADKYKILKVETRGEYYMGAVGIPEPRTDHPVAMARFSWACMKKMAVLSKQLEIKYGPDTGDLALRIALHSGPVTGGFMKGRDSRFQLFGDTMTTTQVIHKRSERNRIHISEETAKLLKEAGKARWLQPRGMTIMTEEKGELHTFWLTRHHGHHSDDGERESIAATDTSVEGIDEDAFGYGSEERWVEWNADILGSLLKDVAARRVACGQMNSRELLSSRILTVASERDMPLDEIQEIIELPRFNKDAVKKELELGEQELPKEVVEEIHEFVTQVASMYLDNPFHNFAHASYVVMAVTKYLNRIKAASEIDLGFDAERNRSSTMEAIHDHTYGIASDPLTHFACAFSALIHDVDHPGVPNGKLIEENPRLASIYNSRSVAEQRSFDMGWDLLMDPQFRHFRSYLCSTETELRRFRQLCVNSVLATDLGDKELKELRNGRWAKAFDEKEDEGVLSSTFIEPSSSQTINRKATIVIEHLIQAADVAHMCQHWGIYRKWNERLFEECYEAYRSGREEKDPSKYWYDGEIEFFDLYIIPLSKKLRDCGVFGSTSDENLKFAKENRALWSKNGKKIVAEMLKKVTKSSMMGETESSTSESG